eukprot:TRINITY_DN11479_c1_g1_i1.p1 TRINITY_DN11479_c1_g1~~TRINITY_DN11479_c1_g1_i1.p1  ORF type:complete len:161 (-),score=24.12 TRINITY_DN11479_c1_g1_i1:138-620(-)
MGSDKFEQSRLRDILLQSLKDPACTVRETAAKQVNELNNSFGFAWSAKWIFVDMKKIYSSSGNYLHRMVPLKAIELMINSNKVTAQEYQSEFNELLVAALKDSISNVRFTACRVVRVIVININLDKTTLESYKQILSKMKKSDQDEDVQFFAGEALENIR